MRIRSCILLALLCGFGHGLFASVLYTVTDLGTLGGGFTAGNGINNAGYVTGTSTTTSLGPLHAFLYSNGQIMDLDLGTIGGGDAFGLGINNAGQVTGRFFTTTGAAHAFLYNNGQVMDLGTLPNYDYSSEGSSINDHGQVTGDSNSGDVGYTPQHAFLYSNGQMIDLGTLGGSRSWGNGINNAGQVTGAADVPGGFSHAFLYSDGTMADLGSLAGPSGSSEGNAINNRGEVVGSSSTSSSSDAFLYSDGQMRDLGTLPFPFSPPGSVLSSSAFAINDSGQVVGDSNFEFCAVIIPFCMAGSNAFIYSNGELTNLNDLIDPALGITLSNATGINDNGQIVANSNGHAYLLTPVPEPSSWALFGLPLVALLVCSRRLVSK